MRVSERHLVVGGIWIASLVFAFAVGQYRSEPSPVAASSSVAAGDTVSPERTTPRAEATRRRTSTPSRRSASMTFAGGTAREEEARSRMPIDAVVVQALRDSDPVSRMQQFSRVLADLDETNIEAVLSKFESLPPGYDRDQELSLLLFRWAQIDGEGAMAYVQRMEAMGDNRWAMFNVLSGWASNDGDAALAWARENSDAEQNPYLIGVINGLAQTDLRQASELLTTFPDGRLRGRAVDILMDGYIQQGPEASMGWVEGLGADAELQQEAAGRLAGRLAEIDPVAYADWATSLPADEARGAAVNAFAREWAQAQPAEAAAWAEALSPLELQVDAMASVVQSWARSDPVAAADWLSQFQPSLDMDQPIMAYIRGVARQDRDEAFVWAEQLTDAELRDNLILRLDQAPRRGGGGGRGAPGGNTGGGR